MKTYIIEQKLTAFVNRYAIYEKTADGQNQPLVAFAEQKRLTFKEEIVFFKDEAKSQAIFKVKAEKALDIHGAFLVTDAAGVRVGAVRKDFGSSILRSTWLLLDEAGQPQLIVQEKDKNLALFRRAWGFIPFLSEIPFPFKYHFVFTLPGSETVVASYTKTTRFYDHYELQIDDDELLKTIGWQTFVAQGVLLDALQGR